MMTTKKKLRINTKIKKKSDHKNLEKAASDLDAFFQFIYNRYSASTKTDVPNLGSFFITSAEVIFSENVFSVSLRKNPKKQTLEILSPPVEEDLKEMRRIFLLNQFGDLILKYQLQAYLQVRELLISITDTELREFIREDLP